MISPVKSKNDKLWRVSVNERRRCNTEGVRLVPKEQKAGRASVYLSGKRTGLEMQMFYSLEELILYRLLFFAL